MMERGQGTIFDFGIRTEWYAVFHARDFGGGWDSWLPLWKGEY
jgi:hypothetical protein